jgi:hypothetical protein
MLIVKCMIVGILMDLAPYSAAAQDSALNFTNVASGTETMVFVVNPGTAIPLPFTVPRGSALEIYVPPFLGENGDLISVQPSIAELPGVEAKDLRISFTTKRPVYTLLLKADDLAWSALEKGLFKFTAPDTNHVESPEAYQLIQFEVEPLDAKLGKNYLFKHNLVYEWSFLLRTEGGQTIPLSQPRTNEPRVVQFVPAPGTLYVSVTLWHGAKPSPRTDREPLTIGKSSEFGWRGAFRFNELTALGIGTLFAIVSGLATFYIGKPAFGTAGDYIALFLWGAGVDQTKNFLQNLERTSGNN